jgi:ATP-dependent Clp protease adaptor protein ClpS
VGTKSDLDVSLENEEELLDIKRYKVVLLNDDFTSMDFVVEILMELFDHSVDSAINIMLQIHRSGRGICGLYTYEIAETKISQVQIRAKESEYPLKAIIEEE